MLGTRHLVPLYTFPLCLHEAHVQRNAQLFACGNMIICFCSKLEIFEGLIHFKYQTLPISKCLHWNQHKTTGRTLLEIASIFIASHTIGTVDDFCSKAIRNFLPIWLEVILTVSGIGSARVNHKANSCIFKWHHKNILYLQTDDADIS